MNCPQILYPHFTRKRRILFARFLETRALYLLCPIVVLALFTWFAISVSQASSGTPSFTAATNFPAGTNPHAVGVGDFNGDNKADLAVANSGSGNISILLGDGAGGFGTATNFPAGLTPVSIAIGDFNGDSKLDLAVANNGDVSHAGDVSILLSDGAGNFSAPTSLTAGVHPYAVVAADLNGDSKLDLAVANYDSSNASLSLGNGLGAFGAVTNFTVGTNPRALVVGDFNKDSKIDLAVANQGSNNVSLLLGDGAGSLAGAVNFGVGTGPVSVATGDLNGDAKPDLIIANFTSGNVSVLLGDGLGGFAGATNFTAGSSPYSVVIADFYGDGKSDIAVANSGAANVSLLLGDGAGSLGRPTNFPVATDPRILATGNFNADSKPDLAVPNFGANNVSLLLNSSMVTATISGTVKDTQNTPIAGATIEAINSSSQLVVATSISDANGHYILTVPLGTYDLKTTPPTGSNFRGVTIPNRSIVGDLVQDITLVPPDFLQLSGRIVDRDGQAMPNVEVQLESSRDVAKVTTRTGADGSYLLQVGQGSYFLRVRSNGAANESGGLGLVPNGPRLFDNGPYRDAGGADNFFLTQDTVRNITIPTRILSGTVRDSNGQPVAGVRLSSLTNYSAVADLNSQLTTFDGYSQNNDGSLGTTDGNGFYRMYVLPTCCSNLINRTTLSNILIEPPVNSGLVGQTIADISIQGDRTLDVILQRSAKTISGRIVDGTGSPIVGVSVILSGSQSAISTTDGNGNYVFVNVSEGRNYTVTPSRTSYQFTPPNAVFNNLIGDQIANFTGTLFTFTVSGSVRDGSSVGVGGVTVTLSGATTAVTQTDNAGAYAFNNVAAFANYSVKASKPNFTFTPSRTDISNLSANQTADFTAAPQPSPSPTPPLDDDFGSTLRNPDKFQFGSLSTEPTAFDPLVTVAQQNGHLEITPRADAFGTHYNGYTTVGAVDVNASTPSVEVVQAAGGGAQTIFSLGADKDNSFGFMVQTGGAGSIPNLARKGSGPLDPAAALLVFQIKINGQLTALSIPYDPLAHRYWRFRYDPASNSIFFETSANNLNWAVQHNVALQKSVTPMAVELASGTSATTTAPGTAVFDNFHLGDKFAIGGQVKTAASVGVSGVLISLNGSLSTTTTTNGSGSYSFAQLEAGGNYTLTPSFTNYSFSPASQTFNSLATNKTADFVAIPGATPTPTPTPDGFTPTGSNVTVQGNGVTLTFAQVTSAGVTTISSINPANAGSLPGGYLINGSSVAFDITTTAAYNPPIEVCFVVASVADENAFNGLSILHNEGGTLVDRTTSRDFATKKLCASVNSLSPFVIASKLAVQFSASSYGSGESAGTLAVTVIRSGDASGVAAVNYATGDSAGTNDCNRLNSGIANSRCDYEAAAGTLRFAAGETSKTILILLVDDVYAEGSESFTITLSNAGGALLGSPAAAVINITDNETTTGTNPIDQAGFFVRLHYLDFFTREPDAGGLGFWTNQITECQQPDATCNAEVRRINVSGAFFLSIEFQETGYLVERLYRVAYGNATGTSTLGGTHQLSVPVIRFNEFLPDTQQIGRGVVVGQAGWEQVLENNKQAFVAEFVQRARFATLYPGTMSAGQYVDTLNGNAGNALSVTERDQLVKELTSGDKTRAQVLRAVAEDADLNTAEFNRAFVLMQFYGYLRRNPNDAPDNDYTGYDFWLGKLNQFNGNFVNAEMVKAFIVSGEYKVRFGP